MAIEGITRLEFNHNGFREVLESPGVESMVDGLANEIARDAGPEFMGQAFVGQYTKKAYKWAGRVMGFVSGIGDANKREAEDKVLSRAAVKWRGER